MKLDFKKNVKRNMVANAVSSGIRLLFPFLNRTLFLWLLGPLFAEELNQLTDSGLVAPESGVLFVDDGSSDATRRTICDHAP